MKYPAAQASHWYRPSSKRCAQLGVEEVDGTTSLPERTVAPEPEATLLQDQS